jgi:hypothetical protein
MIDRAIIDLPAVKRHLEGVINLIREISFSKCISGRE